MLMFNLKISSCRRMIKRRALTNKDKRFRLEIIDTISQFKKKIWAVKRGQRFAMLFLVLNFPVRIYFFLLSCQVGSWCPPRSLPALHHTKILPSSSYTRAWRGFTTFSTSTRRACRSCWNSPSGKAARRPVSGRSIRIPGFSKAGALLLNIHVILCCWALSLRLLIGSIVIKQCLQPVWNKTALPHWTR